jgi:hypothetical protein
MVERSFSNNLLLDFRNQGNPLPKVENQIEQNSFELLPISTVQAKLIPKVYQAINPVFEPVTVQEVAQVSQGINPNYKAEQVQSLAPIPTGINTIKQVSEIEKNSSCKSKNMALAGILSAGVAGAKALQDSKINAVVSGTKTVTKPKTIFGKLIGSVTGRSQAYAVQEELKNTSSTDMYQSNSLLQSSRTPVTGGISFGGQATQKTWLPFAIVGAIIAFFYFNRNKKKRR